jgi:polar amino acid transport system substrate-binding protein
MANITIQSWRWHELFLSYMGRRKMCARYRNLILKAFTFVVTILLFTGPAPVIGQERTVKLVTGNDFAPFSDESLPAGGLATDIIRRIFLGEGYEVEISYLPWKRGFIETKSLIYDGTFPYYPNQKRIEQFLFSDPIYLGRGAVYVSNIVEKELRSIDDLEGLRYCRPLGYTIPSQLKSLIESKRIEVYVAPGPENCLRMIMHDRLDFVLWNADLAKPIFDAVPGSDSKMRVAGIELDPRGMFFIVAKKHPMAADLIAVVNTGLAALHRSGDYKSIVAKHFAPPS